MKYLEILNILDGFDICFWSSYSNQDKKQHVFDFARFSQFFSQYHLWHHGLKIETEMWYSMTSQLGLSHSSDFQSYIYSGVFSQINEGDYQYNFKAGQPQDFTYFISSNICSDKTILSPYFISAENQSRGSRASLSINVWV